LSASGDAERKGNQPGGALRPSAGLTETDQGMRVVRLTLIWAALTAAVCVPIAAAAASPLLAWRGPVYILAGFAGILALGLVLVQPLLAGADFPGACGSSGGGA